MRLAASKLSQKSMCEKQRSIAARLYIDLCQKETGISSQLIHESERLNERLQSGSLSQIQLVQIRVSGS
jgi:hypothetical protein